MSYEIRFQVDSGNLPVTADTVKTYPEEEAIILSAGLNLDSLNGRQAEDVRDKIISALTEIEENPGYYQQKDQDPDVPFHAIDVLNSLAEAAYDYPLAWIEVGW